MKTITILSAAAFVGQAYGAACPYELLHRSGLLSEGDAEKFEAVKRDPTKAETLFRAHRRKDGDTPEAPSADLAERGPADGILDLPLGGGLRKSCISNSDLLAAETWQWMAPYSHLRARWLRLIFQLHSLKD